jgi:hypothetical protein
MNIRWSFGKNWLKTVRVTTMMERPFEISPIEEEFNLGFMIPNGRS